MLTFIDRNGPPEAMHCPAFLCDICLEPISSRGWAAWRPDYPGDDGRPSINGVYTVHAAPDHNCLRRLEHREGHMYTQLLKEVVQQLDHNLTNPFEDDQEVADGDVEYVAPAPSTWRVGQRKLAGRA